MINLTMMGANGRMGRRIIDLAYAADDFTVVAALDAEPFAGQSITLGADSGKPGSITLTSDLNAAVDAADVIIDFSAPGPSMAMAERAHATKTPFVIGTTGFDNDQRAQLEAWAKDLPVIVAPNMSVGVNLLFMLTSLVSKTLGLDYNCEISEIHHNQKKDAPSGTAVRLAERAAEGLGLSYDTDVAHGREGMVGARPRNEIGMHTLRGGDVVGEHTVSFIGQGERVELVHKAHSRDTFAAGALVAARFAVKANPGFYDMQDVLGLK